MSSIITLEIAGRPIKPDDVADELGRALLEGIAAEVREKIGSIRDPETGEFPTIVMRGTDLDQLSIHVEGSPELLAIVQSRLEHDEDFAERIAKSLQENRIETWWDEWSIIAGDSLRQEIDDGLANCTHFIVLLTPQSIEKPWVNQEMDAGLARKLKGDCRFIVVRWNLPATELPPFLSGMYAPEFTGNEVISQLISEIHGVTRKPPLGPAPDVVQQIETTSNGYSDAANAVARLFVENSKHACLGDPEFKKEVIAAKTKLTISDVEDTLHELSRFFDVCRYRVTVQPSLFATFDQYWMPWNAAEDARRIGADIMNDADFPSDCQAVADRYDWDARRLNLAINFLLERDLIADDRGIGSKFAVLALSGKENQLRRFLRNSG